MQLLSGLFLCNLYKKQCFSPHFALFRPFVGFFFYYQLVPNAKKEAKTRPNHRPDARFHMITKIGVPILTQLLFIDVIRKLNFNLFMILSGIVNI